MTDGLLLSGDLSENPLPLLLMSLYRSRETGILTIGDRGYQKSLYIQEGTIIFASSSDPDDRLGEGLLRRGAITVQQYLDSAAQIRPGRRQGEILVDQGAITADQLVEGVREQVYDIIFSLFPVTQGSYSLPMDEFSTLDLITITMEMPFLVLKGIRTMESWSTIYHGVGPPKTRVRTVQTFPPYMADLDLTSDEEHLLNLSRTEMSVSTLLDVSYTNQFETYRTLWMFLSLNLIDKVRSAETAQAPGAILDSEALVEHYNNIYAFIHDNLDQEALDSGEIVTRAVAPIRDAFPGFLEGQVGLASYGRLDIDYILAVLHKIPDCEREVRLRGFLDEILYALMFQADRHLSRDRMRALREYLGRQANV